ncbi:hypothetical protein GCM10025859_46560 [Alicyclobacillus fastidiosus]|nr:hypothetical protein GCM10025859_46560 [Alicyclobacillus fastidiosus]
MKGLRGEGVREEIDLTVTAFFLARWLGRPIVNRFVPTRALEKFDQFMVNRGVSGIFVLRLIPLVSFNALNYASGLTTLTLWQFTWTTGLGTLPATLLIALLYRSVIGQKYAFIGLIIVGVVMLLGLVLRWRLTKK